MRSIKIKNCDFVFSRKIDKYERRRDVSEAANEANNDSSSSGDNGENKTITVNITISSDGNDTVEKVTATIPTTTATTTTAAANTTRDTDETTATVDATKWTEIQRKVSKFNENDYYQLFVTAIILVASVTLVTKACIDTILIDFGVRCSLNCDMCDWMRGTSRFSLFFFLLILSFPLF